MVKPELNPTWVTDGWKTHCNVLIQLCAHLQQQKIVKVQPAVLNESSKIFMVRVYEL